ncbi:membrane lipoprotein [Vibrio phage 1.187.O._10N.286.49.F1]|nr:membrane lipoprotein [Vibrio phage 1.187.O._10N.286.49.F1]
MLPNLQKSYPVLISSVLLGCGNPVILSESYSTEQQAVVRFLKDNIITLKILTSQQEMLGWVLKCGDGFKHTVAEVGGLSNILTPPKVSGCKVSALVHTHPRVPKGYTVDFFSEEDIKTTYRWNSYILSQENCNIRFGSKLKNRDGTLLGKLKFCK